MIAEVIFKDCGAISYSEAWDLQTELFEKASRQKISNRNQNLLPSTGISNYLLFCEHNHVFTIGKSGDENNLLLPKQELESLGIEYFKINRGGDITYHGPGQITGYPIFDLEQFFTDVHKYMRYLEEVIVDTLSKFGIRGGRIDGLTGVWVDYENPETARKICALGVHMGRWITMHGFALNVNTNLEMFNKIIPCGIKDKDVTSISRELGSEVSMDLVKKELLNSFTKVFKVKITGYDKNM